MGQLGAVNTSSDEFLQVRIFLPYRLLQSAKVYRTARLSYAGHYETNASLTNLLIGILG